jgi:hypothetical protein
MSSISIRSTKTDSTLSSYWNCELKTQWLLPWVHYQWVLCELLYHCRIGIVCWTLVNYFAELI